LNTPLCFLDTLGFENLIQRGNVIPAPASVLIARQAKIGSGNRFYPNVVIEIHGHGTIQIGDGNVFHPGTFIVAADGGEILIGNSNEFLETGVSLKANRAGACIRVGQGGRYGGVEVIGRVQLGSGSQVLGVGRITLHDSVLEAGAPYSCPDVPRRGAVLKGCGVAKGLHVPTGQVIEGWGVLCAADLRPQILNHPPPMKGEIP
jgi:acetyltransferase-like isoleucine patch superfamily enzyme